MRQSVIALMHNVLRHVGFDLIRYPEPMSFEERLRALLHDVEPDVVVDIGANVGEFGASLRSLGYAGRIVAFEPASAAYAQLKDRSSGDANWETHQIALGSKAGEMRLNEPANDQLASLLPVTERGQRFWGHLLDDMTQEVVNVVRLDDVWDELIGGVRTIVKIDTQGFDQQVLEGSRGVLDRIAAIQTELSFSKYYEGATTYLDELAWLREHGFMPVALRTVTSDEGGVIAEADCLLRRPRRT